MEPYQIQSVLESLIITAGVIGGLLIVSRTWVKTRLSKGGADVIQLAESVDRLRDSVEGMREELGDVADRLEFTERVLAKVAGAAAATQLLKRAAPGPTSHPPGYASSRSSNVTPLAPTTDHPTTRSLLG
jgi:hypothetical protein